MNNSEGERKGKNPKGWSEGRTWNLLQVSVGLEEYIYIHGKERDELFVVGFFWIRPSNSLWPLLLVFCDVNVISPNLSSDFCSVLSYDFYIVFAFQMKFLGFT